MVTVHPETIDMIDRILAGNVVDPMVLMLYLLFVISLAESIQRKP
jgi:hypothetical protein